MKDYEKEYKEKLKNDLNGEFEIIGEYIDSNTAVLHRHSCGYEWDITPNRIIQRKSCPKCAGKLKKTTESFKEEVEELVGDEYMVLGEYNNNKTKILMKHNTCRHEYEVRPDSFTSDGRRCPICGLNRKPHEKFVEEVKELVGDEYIVLGKYIRNSTKILIKHNDCDYEWEVSPTHFLAGSRCPYCANRKTTNEFKNEVYSLIGDEYTVLGEYINNKAHVKMKHNVCGLEWDTLPTNFISREARCPRCAGKLKRTTDEYKEVVKNLVGDEYTVLGEYVNAGTKVLTKHNTCGHEYEVRPDDFIRGRRCPKCANTGISNLEKEIGEYIKSIYDGEIKFNDKELLDGLEVDIYMPDLKIAIEFNGLYWHSEQKGKDKKYHINKTDTLNEKGIRLIHILEDEWVNKKDIVKSKILHILGLSKKIKIYARKCNTKEIDAAAKNSFLERNHIQGQDTSKYKFGLFYNEKLVSVITFGTLRVSLGSKDENDAYELIRYANDIDFIVIGGFSKLLKHFTKNYKYSIIKTFADLRWSENTNVYETIGFKLKHRSVPNYWYFQPNSNSRERYHRYGFRKQVLKKRFPDVYNDNLTEVEIMEKAGYHRIYDCGNLVYEMIKKE